MLRRSGRVDRVVNGRARWAGARAWLAASAAVIAVASAGATRAQERDDQALLVARDIAARVARFPNFRAYHPQGVWEQHPERVWSIRPTAACHADLRAQNVPFEPVAHRRMRVPAPVRITGAVGGVLFRMVVRHSPVVIACELAARLPAIARVLTKHRVVEVRMNSAWRIWPETSFHTMGLALDLQSFVRNDGSELFVQRDFEVQRGPTCTGPEPGRARAAALRAIACDLAASGVLSTVITPAYSPGHRDHFHIDVRPDDPRFFVR
jgi:hypothetical protein